MVGGDFLSRPRPCMGCSAWDDDDDDEPGIVKRLMSYWPQHKLV